MPITDQTIDQAFSDLRGAAGGVRNDYFGLLYLEQEFDIDRDQAVTQVAFGGNDYGLDGFHFDHARRNLYLFQFKYSESYGQFKSSFHRLIDAGMERILRASCQDSHQNQLLLQLKSCIAENESVIDRICIHFVFLGEPADAERSQVLDKLREDLENKKYLIDQRFGRPVTMVIEFRSAKTRKRGQTTHLRKTHTYPIRLDETLCRTGPGNELMTVGFIRLTDLHTMYLEMGQRFFERNIRAALPDTEAVNRALQQSLKRIVIDGKDDPAVFAFNHNGVTLFAEALRASGEALQIVEPRLLNGAQTVKFREDLGIYYERQEQAFANLGDDDLEDMGITHYKAIELTRLARTFLASEGELDKLSRFREVFEDDRIYGQVFHPNRLRADSRLVVLCYKVQFRLQRLARDIVGKGANKYAYVQRARNLLWALLCQAILNDPKLETRAHELGQGLSLEAQFTEWLSSLATTRVRFILGELVNEKSYAVKVAEGNFSFMRTNAAYRRSMEIAYSRWKWVEKRLDR